MTFEKWLKKQKKRDDRIGDISRDFIDSNVSTIKESFNKHSPCEDAVDSFVEAVEEWKKYVCPLLITYQDEEEDF